MAFDNTEPNDDIEIRNQPGVTRANFVAQLNGDDSFNPARINLADQVATAPSATAGICKIYSLNGTAGASELFVKDDTGVQTQITENGSIGIKTGTPANDTNFKGTEIEIDTVKIGNIENTQKAFATGWGYVSAAGAMTNQYWLTGASYSGSSNKIYTITFPTLDTNKYMVVFTQDGTTAVGEGYIPQILTQNAGSCTYRFFKSTQTTVTDAKHMVMIVGGVIA